MAITSQAAIDKGLRIVDDSRYPISKGQVSNTGMHIPDLDIIDGKNVLPTNAGYISFFGKDRALDDTIIGSDKVQEIITYRTKYGDSIQLALTRNGLYVSSLHGDGTAVRTYHYINLADTSDDLTGGSETISLLTTGDYTLSVYGTAAVTVAAGTATGTGFGQATEGNDITFNITAAGTVTLTLDSGTLDTYLGAYMKKVELGSSSTGFLAYSLPSQIKIELPDGKGSWIRAFWASLGHASLWELWTYAIIDNDLYLYHKGLKYIYRLYAIQPNQVIFDELTPSYIISSDKLWQFHIQAEDDSAGDDTYKRFSITTDSGLFIGADRHYVNKAHYVWNVDKLIQYGKIENLVKAKVDIDALVIFDRIYTDVEVSHNGLLGELIATVTTAQETLTTDSSSGNKSLTFDPFNSKPGTLTLSIGAEEVDIVFTGLEFATEQIRAIQQALDTTWPEVQFSCVSYYTFASAVITITATDETQLQLLSSSYVGTGSFTLSAFSASGANHAYASKVKPYYGLFLYADPFPYPDNGNFIVYVDDTLYTVNYGEDPTTGFASLQAAILANPNFESIYADTTTFIFSKIDSDTWDIGGGRACAFQVNDLLGMINEWGFDTPQYVGANYTALRIQGFKEFTLTSLLITLDGTIYNIPMSSLYDSNDLVDQIVAYIDGSSKSVTTTASATADYDLYVNVLIYDQSIPSATLTQDGTTLWSLIGSTSEIIDLLQVDGIYEARGRLGYWTKDNVNGWSAPNNPIDFEPSTVTKANQISIKGLKGDIIKCVSYENGFVVYATGNVAHASYIRDSDNIFNIEIIEKAPGLIDPRHITSVLGLHYYWTVLGLFILDPLARSVQEQLQEIGDWISTHKYPITLQVLAGRYLVINLLTGHDPVSNRAIRNGETTITGIVDPYISSPIEFNNFIQDINLYPAYKRALIYDAKLQKWGSMDVDYLLLMSTIPINQSGYQLEMDYTDQYKYLDNEQKGLCVLGTDDKVYLLDDSPDDSYLVFGHYATHRTKRTKAINCSMDFVKYPEATIDFEMSFDTATIDWTKLNSKNVRGIAAIVFPNLSAYWFNFVLRGRFHLKRLLVKGQTHGR